MKFLISCVLFLAILLSGCRTAPADLDMSTTDFESYTVVLVPNLQTNQLDVMTDPQGWDKDDKQKGWVGFARGKYGSVNFVLNELPSKSVCTDTPSTSADFVITKLELTKNGNPQTQKGKNFGTNQTGWIENAFSQMNPADGVVIDVDKSKGSTSYVLENKNNDRSQRKAYYQITVTRCSDDLSLMTDPGIGNGGRR